MTPAAELVFSNDPAQRLRLKAWGFATGCYVAYAGLAFVQVALGLSPLAPTVWLAMTVLLTSAAFYVALRSGWNLRFKRDPALALGQLDDSAITHMVYPKDLVAWARANKHLSEPATDDRQHGRCEAGQPCPREGFWFTPAQAGSRRQFKAGDVMPEVGGDYGATIWQWDQTQAP